MKKNTKKKSLSLSPSFFKIVKQQNLSGFRVEWEAARYGSCHFEYEQLQQSQIQDKTSFPVGAPGVDTAGSHLRKGLTPNDPPLLHHYSSKLNRAQSTFKINKKNIFAPGNVGSDSPSFHPTYPIHRGTQNNFHKARQSHRRSIHCSQHRCLHSPTFLTQPPLSTSLSGYTK